MPTLIYGDTNSSLFIFSCRKMAHLRVELIVMVIIVILAATCIAVPVNDSDPGVDAVRQNQAKRHARWTFQNLQEQVPVNGSEALQYDPIMEEAASQSLPNDSIRPDKILKSSHDATIIMNQLSGLKRDFCKSDTIVQRIKEEGCIGRNVINRYCYGQCNSFYIPEGPKRKRARGYRRNNRIRQGSSTTSSPEYLDDEDLTGAAFKSCPNCRPTKFIWITVTLRCPKLSPPYRKKRIQKIRQCKCKEGN